MFARFRFLAGVAVLWSPPASWGQDAVLTEATPVASPTPLPAAQPSPTGSGFYAGSLEGEQRCRGSNPDGTNYQGTVRIHVQDGAVLMEWTVNGKKTYGTGLVQGNTLAVGLENGVAVYQILTQPQGLALVGRWATEGAKAACSEVILAGSPEETNADFPVEKINGQYRLLTERADGSQDEEPFTISGGDAIKKITLKGEITAQGLLFGRGLAVIPPSGLIVLEITRDSKNQTTLSGQSLEQTTLSKVALVPAK